MITTYEPGDRVTRAGETDGGPGTVIADLGNDVYRVVWDITQPHDVTEFDALQLVPDAELPDPKFALAKALRYKSQRDSLLAQRWADAGALANERQQWADDLGDAKTREGLAWGIASTATAQLELAQQRLAEARKLLEASRDHLSDETYGGDELCKAVDRFLSQ